MIQTIHRARFVLAETDLLLEDAAVHVCEPGRICLVEPWRHTPHDRNVRVVDWGSAVIMPGLVNAHTHLELTRMHNRLTGLSSFTQWLTQLVQTRRAWTTEDHVESVRSGARMALVSGTTLVGDISASGISAQTLIGEKLRKVVFEEALGFTPMVAQAALADLETRLGDLEQDPLLTLGASPHAPYSVSPELYRGVAELARSKSVPLATHLAESEAEVEFLRSGSGEFRDFLSRLGLLPEGWSPPGLAPVDYMESMGVLEQSPLLIHCNYVDQDSISRIQRRGCSVVYCPRSHAFFGHEKHPVRDLLDAGVNVALGTDSLASNESLSMLDEIRFLRRIRRDLRSDEIFRMVTLNGATALRFGGVLGLLRPGFWADMAILELPRDANVNHLKTQILEGAGACIATIVRGNVAWSKSSTCTGE